MPAFHHYSLFIIFVTVNINLVTFLIRLVPMHFVRHLFWLEWYLYLGQNAGSGAASWNSWNMPQNSGSTGPSGTLNGLLFIFCYFNMNLPHGLKTCTYYDLKLSLRVAFKLNKNIFKKSWILSIYIFILEAV